MRRTIPVDDHIRTLEARAAALRAQIAHLEWQLEIARQLQRQPAPVQVPADA